MLLGLIEGEYLEDIAEAIREQYDTEDTYTPPEMAEAIRGFEYETEELEVTENGEYYPSEGILGFSSVVVDVPVTIIEPELGTKTINKNGTYEASNDGLDGYSKVTVKIKKLVGKKSVSSGGDGNEHVASIDDDGNLSYSVLPSSIVITTNPTKISYDDGETISKSGMIVKAYKADGNLWEAAGYTGGVIPNNELTLDPTNADASQSSQTIYVNWNRPEDNKELTDTFNISINE